MGSSPYFTKFSNQYDVASLQYVLNLDKASVSFDAGVIGEFQRINGEKYNDCYPFSHLYASWALNNRNQLRLWFQYANNSPDVAERSPNVIQSNEMMYQTGYPMAKNSRHVTVNLSYTFLPCNKFSMTAFTRYYGLYKQLVTMYELYGNNALLQTYGNSGDYTNYKIGAQATLRLLNNNLTIALTPSYNYYGASGYLDANHNAFVFTGYIAYYLGDFNFSAYYCTRDRSMSIQDGAYSTSKSMYQLQAGWSKGNWNLQVAARCFGRYGYANQWSDIATPLYDRRIVTYNANYRAGYTISATYTFGYGKKVNRGDEVGAQSEVNSAIMK
jgi:hypothetical protein